MRAMGGVAPVHYYGLRAVMLAALLSGAALLPGALWFGTAGLAVASAVLFAVGWAAYFHSERTVLTAFGARPVSEVERPELYGLGRGVCFAARRHLPRLPGWTATI